MALEDFLFGRNQEAWWMEGRFLDWSLFSHQPLALLPHKSYHGCRIVLYIVSVLCKDGLGVLPRSYVEGLWV